MFWPVTVSSCETSWILPVRSKARRVETVSIRRSPIIVRYVHGTARRRMHMRNANPMTTAIPHPASTMYQVETSSAVMVPISPPGFDMKFSISANSALSTGRPTAASFSRSSLVRLAGIAGMHLKNTSDDGYVGYQHSVPLEVGRKQLSVAPSPLAKSPLFLWLKKNSPTRPASVQLPPGHLYAPTSSASVLLKENAGGHVSMHTLSSGDRGLGMYIEYMPVLSPRPSSVQFFPHMHPLESNP
mmetsp:Transcript_60527/g.143933  ORF Transcript_60527/g.143933 Transcript_60527/m.143933 type:complete len:243 (-) Transcript_60527:425-1153(-)